MNKKIPAIYVSHDYKSFTHLTGNRKLVPAHVRNLTEAFAADPDTIMLNPVLVNDEMEVIDGQHRLAALEALGLPVYYLQIPGLKLADAQHFNTIVKTWGPADWGNSYAEAGNRNYIQFMKLWGDYPFAYGVIALYCADQEAMRGHTNQARTTMKGSTIGHAFRRGSYKILPDEQCRERLDKLLATGDYFRYYKTRDWAEAVFTAILEPGFNFTEFYQKLGTEFAAEQLHHRQSSRPEYLRVIEAIYNYRRGAHDQFYFSSHQMAAVA